jgi:hypothetical protein
LFMKNKLKENNDSGYLKNIQKVWDLKEAAYEETKDMKYSEYLKYIRDDIKKIKVELKHKYIKL